MIIAGDKKSRLVIRIHKGMKEKVRGRRGQGTKSVFEAGDDLADVEGKVLKVVTVEVELILLKLGDVIVEVGVIGSGEDLGEEDQHVEVMD